MTGPTPPNVYKQLSRALAQGELAAAEQILSAIPNREGPGAPSRQPSTGPQLSEAVGNHLWSAIESLPLATRLAGYALLERHGIPLGADHALSLLWAADHPQERAYWHQRGISLDAHRDRLVQVMFRLPEGGYPSGEDVRFSRQNLAHVFQHWAQEDPTLFATPIQRSHALRLSVLRHAYPGRIEPLLSLWATTPVDMTPQLDPTEIQLGHQTFVLPVGNALTDLVGGYMKNLENDLRSWRSGPPQYFAARMAKFEACVGALLNHGARWDDRDANGLTAAERLAHGEAGRFLKSWGRQQRLAADPVSSAATTRRPRA